MLASLGRAYPKARIDWLVRDTFAAAIDQHPGLHLPVLFTRGTMGQGLKQGRSGELRALLRKLREPGYDLVLDCQGLFRSGFFAWWTRSPVRVGYANAREGGWLGVNRRAWVDPRRHAVDRMLELVRLAGVEPVADMRLYTAWQDRDWLPTAGLQGPFAVIAPTSKWMGKRWPAERFAEVAAWLLEQGVQVAIVGGPGEREQCGPLLELASNRPGVVDLIGRTSVGQLMAVVEASAIVIANDSAALHMAVGFGRPLVALFGPTDVARVGPYGRAADVIQHIGPEDRLAHKDERAGRALMERITVAEVIERLPPRLARSP